MKPVAIKDANVFIDLESMGILDLWFQLGYQTLTSSFVSQELERGGHLQSLSYIESGQMESINLELIEFYELYSELEESELSVADISVLHLAISRRAIILSGDGALRAESERRRIEYHGSLWILEQLVSEKVLEPKVAAQKLEHLLELEGEKRRFLPIKICLQLIERWRR